MKTRRVFVAAALLAFSTFAGADKVVVGTTLTSCFATPTCVGGGSAFVFVLPGQFLAQSFVLNETTQVTRIPFTVGVFPIGMNPNGSASIDYHTLTFQMQLTSAIGPESVASNVLATQSFTVPTTMAFAVLSFPVGQTLEPGTYYLVASTRRPIPNAARVLGWGEAGNFFPNTGSALSASGEVFVNNIIWDLLNICTAGDCRPNVGFPPASLFIPERGPLPGPPFQFQVCSGGGSGCGDIQSGKRRQVAN